jgi:hypothetical protein
MIDFICAPTILDLYRFLSDLVGNFRRGFTAMRRLNCFALTSIVFVLITVNAFAQKPEPRQKHAESTQQTEVAGTAYCPIYPYAYHGSYVSYYALRQGTCDQPASVDGPPNLLGNCLTGNGCLSQGFAPAKVAEARPPHLTSKDLKKSTNREQLIF